MRQFKPRRNSWDSTYGNFCRDGNNVDDFITKTNAKYHADPTSSSRREDIESLCRGLIHENLTAKTRATNARPRFHGDAVLPYSDNTMALLASVCLSVGLLELAQRAVVAVEKHIPLGEIRGLAAHFRRYSFLQLRGW